ncbi:MAG: BREX-2 system adenine-specific DNA-methyltransferase PglX [Dactylosporangium sp.]|nr:BREX-2 system adenine-specific DNA-methyltransferase PglX [Dactylosporangium sp.]NNJ61414.1 BREX-2 system adenine-specific DNA-methyltransferase PglX [Dactylosporangium sp.]
MSATTSLTGELRAEVKRLEDDLRARVAALPEIDKTWREQHEAALRCGRTGASWQEWSDDRITQAAVAWVLIGVFIRFAEDNALVRPVWISGPKQRRAEALGAQAEFLRTEARTNPDVTDREWLLQAIGYLAKLPATRGLVDETSALWLVTPSGDAATRLLDFWRERDDSGELRRDLRDEDWDTRFLGDLYQDLSEEAKSRYALLQTPVFVEEFILDRTLEPALKERPLEGFSVIDPTCGSGHFLLGAFQRLRERWEIHAPGIDDRARVQRALDAIHGVDLNPAAVSIARFRLTIAALQASGDKMLEGAPAFNYHLAVGDSLLHGLDQEEFDYGVEYSADRTAATHVNPTENMADLKAILNNRYDVVVGNPPYITVKDKALNKEYRKDAYPYGKYLKGTYALTVPFMVRFFHLAKTDRNPGWVGQITSNSFMKREFGGPLIGKFFPTKDLRLVCDTSGAYIPGHGTPTVILVGRNTEPVSETVRAVLGVRGEPGRPEEAAKGLVWTAITEHIDDPDHSDDWVTIADLNRSHLAAHPWALGGNGAPDVLTLLKTNTTLLARRITSIGYTGQTNADDAFLSQHSTLRRKYIGPELFRPFLTGDDVRDYIARANCEAIFPYRNAELLPSITGTPLWKWMWPVRTYLWARATFGRSSYKDEGRPWWGWHQVAKSRVAGPAITWAFMQTTNHFAFLDECMLHNRHAPIIKLPEGATEDDHLALLGVLNSSTACFWLKQNSHDKGIRGEGGGFTPSDWERFYEFTGTTLQDFPLPGTLPLGRGRLLDQLAQRLAGLTPQAVAEAGTPTRDALTDARRDYDTTRAEMIAQQEELDWEVYRLYGLIDEDLTYPGDDLPGLALGERAFEVVLARAKEETAWFARHHSTPITELPSGWPPAYRALVERRIALIESHPYLRLLERPEHKRRWAVEAWEKQEERALRGWLLDRLEDQRFWFDRHGVPTPRSVAQLADDVARDPDLVSVLALWEGRPDLPVTASLEKLLAKETVPFLAAYRYKDTGLRKREAWEHTWALQRREDAGETFGAGTPNGPIPVPPKYTSADFRRKEYWDHRGKLDVPKERFVGYPDAGRSTDPTPVLGWAGWDHAQQAFALDQLIGQRESEGWAEEKLIPLVAGLVELLPWVRQWHAEPEPFYGGSSPADFFAELLTDRCRQVERTPEQLAAWRPEPIRRGRGTRKVVTA